MGEAATPEVATAKVATPEVATTKATTPQPNVLHETEPSDHISTSAAVGASRSRTVTIAAVGAIPDAESLYIAEILARDQKRQAFRRHRRTSLQQFEDNEGSTMLPKARISHNATAGRLMQKNDFSELLEPALNFAVAEIQSDPLDDCFDEFWSQKAM